MVKFAESFSQQNIQRIYLGRPALVDGKTPSEILNAGEYETLSLIVDGLTWVEAAQELELTKECAKSRISGAYDKLEISSKDDLPGFFPLTMENPLLDGKTLGDLRTRQLQIIEELSRGRSRADVAAERGIARTTLNCDVSRVARQVWPECETSIDVIRVANGIRAQYARKFEEAGRSVDAHMGAFALGQLVEYEPRIREIFKL